MTSATFTPDRTLPRSRTGSQDSRRLTTALRAIGAFTTAAVGVVLLGDYGGEEAGVRNPRPEYRGGPD